MKTRNEIYGGTFSSPEAPDTNANGELKKLVLSDSADITKNRSSWIRTILYNILDSFTHKTEDRDSVTATPSTLTKYVAKDQLPEITSVVNDMTDGSDTAGNINMFDISTDVSGINKLFKLSFSTAGLNWLLARTWLQSELVSLINDTVPPGVDPDDFGDKYKTTSTLTFIPSSALNTTKVFPTPTGMSYSSGVRLRATSATNAAYWVEGIVTTYSGTNVIIAIDNTSETGVEVTNWLLNIGGSNSFIMNNKIYASAATITSEFAGSTTATIWQSIAGSTGTADFDNINLTLGQAYFALRLESVVSDLAATCFDTISYGEKPNTNLLPQVSGNPRFGYFKAPKTANYKCKFSCSILPSVDGTGTTTITFYIRKSPQIPVSPEINVGQTIQRTLSYADHLTLINLTTGEVIVSLNQDEILQLTYLLTAIDYISTNITIKLGSASFTIEEV